MQARRDGLPRRHADVQKRRVRPRPLELKLGLQQRDVDGLDVDELVELVGALGGALEEELRHGLLLEDGRANGHGQQDADDVG